MSQFSSFPSLSLLESLVDLQALSPFEMPIHSAWKFSQSTANEKEELALSETEFPYLDSKPENDRKNGKNRHAGEQLLKKKLAGQAYMVKTVLQGSKSLGKKRRARILSENSEDMKSDVPYSMNRKNRWELKSAADLMRTVQFNENVSCSAIDSLFAADGNMDKNVLAYHVLDKDGSINSRTSRSKKGSNLTSLGSESEKPLEVRYVMSKAHPVTKCVAANSFKNKPIARSTKRAQMDISVYSTDGELNEPEEEFKSAPEETLLMYRPRNSVYTLADFIMEKSTTVMVRSRPFSDIKDETYVQVEMPAVEKSVDYTNNLARGPFMQLDVDCSNLGLKSRVDWLSQCSKLDSQKEINFFWLNEAKVSFQVDASSLLGSSHSPLLILTFAFNNITSNVRVTVNGSQECGLDVQMIEYICSTPINNLETLILLIIKHSRVILMQEKQVTNINMCNAEYNSSHLSTCISPFDDYTIMGNIPLPCVLNNHRETEDEDAEEDDFEHVDLWMLESDQNIDSKWLDEQIDEQVADMKTICEECGETNTANIIHLHKCGHAICIFCLEKSLKDKISKKEILHCPIPDCKFDFPLFILPSFLPLPLVMLATDSRIENAAKKTDCVTFKCPTGCGIALIQKSLPYNQVQCKNCSKNWCSNCRSHPHWPMTCAHVAKWNQKFDLQSQKEQNNLKNKTDKQPDNEISQQFWKTSYACHRRRIDIPASRSIAKEIRKRLGYKFERQFMEIRKTCLQLIENGIAWLYMTRSERPINWSQVKNVLNLMYTEFNILENSVIYNAQSAAQVADQFQKVRKLLQKTLTEIAQSK